MLSINIYQKNETILRNIYNSFKLFTLWPAESTGDRVWTCHCEVGGGGGGANRMLL